MFGWFRQKWVQSKRELPIHNSSAPDDQESLRTIRDASPLSSSSSPLTSPPPPSSLPAVLTSPVRWTRKYDLCLCYSRADVEVAMCMASYLEAQPRSLRCFLWQRDDRPGGAISTELCRAVQSSHCQALLITPNFIVDEWCKYLMHQALAEGPMSNCIIPLRLNLPFSQYPSELRFYSSIDLARNTEKEYELVFKTVLMHLAGMIKKAPEMHSSMDSSNNVLNVFSLNETLACSV
ncbi:toll/interleukin-1 receptor domain-containing adapter protein isoform X2 [Osmerus eperlanus]|uniref:toll/interleukin-1 receptor domain-containing adapter protein isoform X2 n=1 Tax=Osmerus eperlanus TaxID=29151 RepID=UPI002E15CBF7